MDPFDHFLSVFGGRALVAEVTNASQNAITQWRQAGVPFKFWFDLLEAAERRGLKSATRAVLIATRPTEGEAHPKRQSRPSSAASQAAA